MKTTEQLNADTLFAFQMALKGHEEFEYCCNEHWHKTNRVFSDAPHRIYHDIPEGWTRHYGEDWKGDKDAKFEGVMFCDGLRTAERTVCELRDAKLNTFNAQDHKYRIYAYKLAAKSPAIPKGFTKHDGGKCPIAIGVKFDLMFRTGYKAEKRTQASQYRWTHKHEDDDIIAYRVIEKELIPWEFNTRPKEPTFVYRKGYITDSMIVAWGDDVVVIATKHGLINVTYDELLSDWLRSGGSVCGKEVEQ